MTVSCMLEDAELIFNYKYDDLGCNKWVCFQKGHAKWIFLVSAADYATNISFPTFSQPCSSEEFPYWVGKVTKCYFLLSFIFAWLENILRTVISHQGVSSSCLFLPLAVLVMTHI